MTDAATGSRDEYRELLAAIVADEQREHETDRELARVVRNLRKSALLAGDRIELAAVEELDRARRASLTSRRRHYSKAVREAAAGTGGPHAAAHRVDGAANGGAPEPADDLSLERVLELQRRLFALNGPTSLETHQISSRRRLALRLSDAETESNRRLIGHELARRGREKWADRWHRCRSVLTHRQCVAPAHHNQFSPAHCELRICPWCARRRAAAQVAELCEILEHLNRAGAFQRGRSTNRPSFKMLTLTLKVGGELRAQVRAIAEQWRRLQKLVGFEKDKREGLFGAVATVEIGPHRNVHMHVLYWGRYVPHQLLSERWHELTGDSHQVEIHELRGSWRDAAREVVKYVTKAAGTANWIRSPDQEPSVPEVLLVDVLEAFTGRRRLMTYGLFYNVATGAIEAPQVCPHCGAVLRYLGTCPPEYMAAADLHEWLTNAAGPPREAAA